MTKREGEGCEHKNGQKQLKGRHGQTKVVIVAVKRQDRKSKLPEINQIKRTGDEVPPEAARRCVEKDVKTQAEKKRQKQNRKINRMKGLT